MPGGKTQTKNIFPQYTAHESRTINCMAQEGKNEDTGEKNKDTGGKNIIYFPPVEILSSDIVTKKDCVQREKYDLISLLQYFPPSTQSVRVEKLLHGLRGKNKDTGRKNIIYFPPVGFLCSVRVTIKIIGGKILYYVPYCLHFFLSFP